jgi:hypothetical protein
VWRREHDNIVIVAPANPRTIEAAYDMLEALKDIIDQAEKTSIALPADLSDSIRVLGKAAVAKAEGSMS